MSVVASRELEYMKIGNAKPEVWVETTEEHIKAPMNWTFDVIQTPGRHCHFLGDIWITFCFIINLVLI